MPIGVNESDRSKFVVSSEQIIERIFHAGANSVHFVLGSRKMFVADYFAYQHLFEGKVNFNSLSEAVEELGMPYTIDSIFEQIRDHDYVMMGMPDTVIEPSDCYRRLLQLLQERSADLALGLFRTDSRNRGGYVEFERDSKRVTSHLDKTSSRHPEGADNAWAIACWNRKFTQYMHDLILRKSHPTIRNAFKAPTELLFGDVIDIAISDRSVHTIADYVDEQNGFYWDITEPEKYFQLLRYYSPGDVGPQLAADVGTTMKQRSKRVFIGHGHSKCWETLRDLLRDRLQLEWEEFNRVPTPGMTTQQRLRDMIDGVGFAFLVMTAEEETSGGGFRTRDNVIHEVGLFQGRLGFMRAVILLEEGCNEFSNITGLNQIRFPKGNLLSKSEEIRLVLEREGILSTA